MSGKQLDFGALCECGHELRTHTLTHAPHGCLAWKCKCRDFVVAVPDSRRDIA